MEKQRSIAKIYFYSLTFLSLTIIILLGFLWANEEIQQFQAESKSLRQDYLTTRQKLIQTEVDPVVANIEYQKSLAEQRLRKDVQMRTNEAYDTALYIYQQNKDARDLAEIKQMVHDALFAASWDEGRGYYFAEDMQGTELVNRNNPDLEGKNILDIKDSKGNFLMQDIIAVAKSAKGEGFCSYYWNKPENPGVLVPKISYVKYFAPFDWVIGNGKYLDDEENKIKAEILSWIDKISFDEDRYVFVGTWQGDTLSGPAKGKNMFKIEDSNGVKIVQELIRAAKSGSGFVQYVMPKFEGQRPEPKISYAKGVADWQWYVGTGVYLDEIETVITQRLAELKRHITLLIFKIISFSFLLVVFSFFLVRRLTGRIKLNLEIFNDFFRKAETSSLYIKEEDVFFKEFRSLATSANQMIKLRNNFEKEKLALEVKLTQAEKMEAIGTLAGGIAHDFNNILSAIIGYTDMSLLDTDPDSEVYKNLKEVRNAGQRAAELTKQILAFSRRSGPELSPVMLQPVIKEVVKLLRATIPTTIDINLNIAADSASAVVMADQTKIHQILLNLCTNAFHAMRETGGTLNVSTTIHSIGQDRDFYADLELDPGQYFCIEVSDTGRGMDAETLSRIFEPYFTTKQTGEGTGMGLSVVHGIVKSHHGGIHVTSRVNQGSSFLIFLPVVKSVRQASSGFLPENSPGGHERILVVDDEETLVSMYQGILESLGYKVTISSSSVEALQFFKEHHDDFDLVITDMTMPKMTGAELAQKLLLIKPDIKIILCTGYSEMIDEERAHLLGIHGYLQKPIVLNTLACKIRFVLDSANS